MKELSVEEKAKLYDKAIAHARLLLKTIGNATLGNLVLKNEFKTMFTALEESEDEKIRKGIIRNLEYLMDRAEGFVKDELKERIAWLEKQGKWNTDNSIWHKVKPNEYVLEKTLICKKNGEIDLVEDTILSVTNAQYALPVSSLGMPKPLEKQDEQKPAWSEEDERMYKSTRIALTLKSAEGYLKSWYITPEEADNWLKSIKDRVQPQNTWKPSDEQMKMLNEVIRNPYLSTAEYNGLIALREQFKAL